MEVEDLHRKRQRDDREDFDTVTERVVTYLVEEPTFASECFYELRSIYDRQLGPVIRRTLADGNLTASYLGSNRVSETGRISFPASIFLGQSGLPIGKDLYQWIESQNSKYGSQVILFIVLIGSPATRTDPMTAMVLDSLQQRPDWKTRIFPVVINIDNDKDTRTTLLERDLDEIRYQLGQIYCSDGEEDGGMELATSGGSTVAAAVAGPSAVRAAPLVASAATLAIVPFSFGGASVETWSR